MNTELWNKILNFNLDIPIAEYGFSTRLADENFWTKNFTAKAIIEYKKFIYLAATSEFMVSPPEIVDAVWHEHIIFTYSYADLCSVVGKNIQHIPSTGNKEEFEKFRLAKERTKKLYNEAFGEQPKEIWEYNNMFAPLNLPKLKYKIRTFIIIGILSFFVLCIPFYSLLRPVYIHIGNPDFLMWYVTILICSLIALETYNKRYLKKIVRQWQPYTFIYDLSALELVYLKTGKLTYVIHGIMNEFLNQDKIILDGNLLQSNYQGKPLSTEEYILLEAVKSVEPVTYAVLLSQLVQKPIFANIANCMNAFRKYFTKSKVLGQLFYLNFISTLFLLMLGFVRLLTGLTRGKPIELISITLIIAAMVFAAFLWRVVTLVCSNTIPNLYKTTLMPLMPNINNWDWQYFLIGTAILSSAFTPLVNSAESSGSDSSSSSCGSSGCSGGGSCGSSCGGCGGG